VAALVNDAMVVVAVIELVALGRGSPGGSEDPTATGLEDGTLVDATTRTASRALDASGASGPVTAGTWSMLTGFDSLVVVDVAAVPVATISVFIVVALVGCIGCGCLFPNFQKNRRDRGTGRSFSLSCSVSVFIPSEVPLFSC
jgi:hypothetical protein